MTKIKAIILLIIVVLAVTSTAISASADTVCGKTQIKVCYPQKNAPDKCVCYGTKMEGDSTSG